MRILVGCPLPEQALDELRNLGSALVYEPEITHDALVRQISDVGVLVVGSARVSSDVIERGSALQLIIRAGAGTPNIAVEEASAAGVLVSHCPEQDAASVAEFIMAALLSLERRLVDGSAPAERRPESAARREGERSAEPPLGRSLAGRTLGLLGFFGPAGESLARRAAPFDMQVVAWTPTPGNRTAPRNVTFVDWPRELTKRSDAIAVYAPPYLNPEQVVDEEFLSSLARGTALVYVGHPGMMDDAALGRAVAARQLRVAVDVSAEDPSVDTARVRARLSQVPNVLVTHRLASSTEQVRNAIAAEVVHIARSFLISGEVVGCVNLAERSPATWQLVLRVRDAVGVMAMILDAIRADGINAEEITSRVFRGARAALCTIALDERPSAEALNAIRAIEDVLHLELRAVV